MSLTPEDRKRIGDDIRAVEFGWPVGMPLCRSISGRRGLWEIRAGLSGGRNARVLFCIHGGSMVLLHGFIKKSRKALDSDLDLAMSRMMRVVSGGIHEGDNQYLTKEDDVMNDDNEQGGRVGQSFEDFLKEQGTYEETTERAIKRVLAFQVAAEMERDNVSKAEMAQRMGASDSQLDSLLDPESDGVSLLTLASAAKTVGRTLEIDLV